MGYVKLLYPTSRSVADIAEIIAPHPAGVVRATMVIGRDGGSSIDADSAPLSHPTDRALYWALRNSCDVILVGSKSSTHPGYAKVSVPVVSVSRSTAPDLHALISELKAKGQTRILCEGGATFLSALMSQDLVDELYLTISSKESDSSSTRITSGEKSLVLKSLGIESGYLFTHYGRIDSANAGATSL